MNAYIIGWSKAGRSSLLSLLTWSESFDCLLVMNFNTADDLFSETWQELYGSTPTSIMSVLASFCSLGAVISQNFFTPVLLATLPSFLRFSGAHLGSAGLVSLSQFL